MYPKLCSLGAYAYLISLDDIWELAEGKMGIEDAETLGMVQMPLFEK